MAECALPARATRRARRVFLCAGIAAASAPDIDLVYTGLAESPIGYLLHHRGHSHTLPGLLMLGLVIVGILRAIPATWSQIETIQLRCALLIGAALASHLLMDAANNYGTLLLYPFSTRWVHGDAIFILEPWLWVILGSALVLNARRMAWRLTTILLAATLLGAVTYVALISTGTLVVLVGAAGMMTWLLRAADARRRAAIALTGTALIFALLLGLSQAARAQGTRAATQSADTQIIDIVLDANAAVPWCWSMLTLERPTHGPEHELLARRGTLSLLPSLWPVSSCATYRILTRTQPADPTSTTAAAWHRAWHIDARDLRAVYTDDCRARAWLRFGRIPFLSETALFDLRFENPVSDNISVMRRNPPQPVCPEHIPEWTPPRADILMALPDE